MYSKKRYLDDEKARENFFNRSSLIDFAEENEFLKSLALNLVLDFFEKNKKDLLNGRKIRSLAKGFFSKENYREAFSERWSDEKTTPLFGFQEGLVIEKISNDKKIIECSFPVKYEGDYIWSCESFDLVELALAEISPNFILISSAWYSYSTSYKAKCFEYKITTPVAPTSVFLLFIETLKKEYLKVIDEYVSKKENEKQKEINDLHFGLNQYLENKNNQVSKYINDNKSEWYLSNPKSFEDLLMKHEKSILDSDSSLMHKFIKLNNYLQNKYNDVQNYQNQIQNINTNDIVVQTNKLNIKNKNNELTYEDTIEDLYGILKNEIYTFNLMIFHATNMLYARIKNNLIIYYEIFESFDELGVFESNWEKKISKQLVNISENLQDLIYTMNIMEQSIIDAIGHLSYTTKSSFENLQASLIEEMREIDNSIKASNMLSLIKTYQLYKINKQTKPLLPK